MHLHTLVSMNSGSRPASTSSIRLPEPAGLASQTPQRPFGALADFAAGHHVQHAGSEPPLPMPLQQQLLQLQEQEQEGLLHLVLETLTTQHGVSRADATLYHSLWQQLDRPRQMAALQLLLAAVVWQRNPAAAVEHIRIVIGQNQDHQR
jgi:hypothetical protein